MALEDFLLQEAEISVEATAGQLPAQDALGGADRSAPWPVVVSGVPCLVNERAAELMAMGARRDDARRNVVTARIYFAEDPVPGGMSSRHRITVTKDGRTLGVYAVQGAIDPNQMGRIFQVDCERIKGGL